MIEAGEVGAVFVVKDEASATLARLAREFIELDKLINAVKRSMGALGSLGLDKVSKQIGGLDKQLLSISESADEAAGGAGAAFKRLDGSIDKSIERIGVLKADMAGLAKSRVGSLPGPRAPSIRNGGRHGGAGGGSGGGGDGEGHDGMSLGFHAPGVGPAHLHQGSDGFMEAVGAAALGEAIAKLAEAGNTWTKISRDMAESGVSPEQIGRAQMEANRLSSQFQNMSAVDVMKVINDARMTLGDQDKATEHAAPLIEAGSFLRSLEGYEKGSGDFESIMKELNAALKSSEIAGKITPESMAEHVKELTAMKLAYGDQLKIEQYLTAQRAGGVALRNTSDDFRYGMFPALVQENGPNAGTMLMTAFQKVVAGTGNRSQSLENMVDIGLLRKDQLNWDKAGHAKGVKNMEGLTNSQDAAMNFGDWVEKTLKPTLDKKLDSEHVEGLSRQIRESQLISSMFPDRNAAKAITEILQQYTKLEKDAGLMAQARKTMDATEYNSGSFDYGVEAVGAQFQNLMKAIGGPDTAQATAGLQGLAGAIGGVAGYFDKHPVAGEAAGDTIAAGAAGLSAIVLGKASEWLGLIPKGVTDSVTTAMRGLVGKGFAGAAILSGPLQIVALGSLTSPEDQKILDEGIADEKAAAAAAEMASANQWSRPSLPERDNQGSQDANRQASTAIGNMVSNLTLPLMPITHIGPLYLDNPSPKNIGSEISAGIKAARIGANMASPTPDADEANASPATPADRVTRAGLPYLDNANLAGIGNEVSSAIKAIPPPKVAVDTKVDVKVTLDGAAIAAAVSTRITNQNRTINSASGFDSSAHWAPPDMR